MADPADARRRAEEALRRVLANAAAIVRLSWSDGATPSDRANLERIKSAAADIAQDHKILRALLAAEPAKAPFVSRNEEWGLRPDFTTAGVTAPPPSAAVREAAEALEPINTIKVACGTADKADVAQRIGRARVALDAALRATASPAPGSEEAREHPLCGLTPESARALERQVNESLARDRVRRNEHSYSTPRQRGEDR